MGKKKNGLVTPEEAGNDPEVLDLTGDVLKKHVKIKRLLHERAELYDLEQEIKTSKTASSEQIKAAFEKAGIRKAVASFGQVFRVDNAGRATLDKKALATNMASYLPANLVEEILEASTKVGKPYSTYNYKAVKKKG